MKSLKQFFPGFSLSSLDFRKVTKNNITFLAAIVPWIPLTFLTREDEENDFIEGMRFPDAEVFFETEDGCVWRIYKDKFDKQPVWVLDSTKKQFEKYLFDAGEIYQFKVEVGKKFAYSKFKLKVTKITLVLAEPFGDKNLLQESEIVTKFNLAKKE